MGGLMGDSLAGFNRVETNFTSGADLTFATCQPRTRKRTSNPKAPLESIFC
jgi:hypothetical protein